MWTRSVQFRWGTIHARVGEVPAIYEDIFWSLLNSTEFVFNH